MTRHPRHPVPKMIPNPLYCERCEGRGYLVGDAEWEPYAVRCPDCALRPGGEKRETDSPQK
jgi:hypothetical protein